jgi:hypothetical protein
LPTDAVVDLQTPTDFYTEHGDLKNDVAMAEAMTAETLSMAMYDLINYAIHTNLGGQYQGQSPRGTHGRIRIHVGQAVSSMLLPWDVSKQSDFTPYANVKSKVYTGLADDVIRQIKILGPKLFDERGRGAGGTS